MGSFLSTLESSNLTLSQETLAGFVLLIPFLTAFYSEYCQEREQRLLVSKRITQQQGGVLTQKSLTSGQIPEEAFAEASDNSVVTLRISNTEKEVSARALLASATVGHEKPVPPPEEVVVRAFSLLKGAVPDLVPSSIDSISTEEESDLDDDLDPASPVKTDNAKTQTDKKENTTRAPPALAVAVAEPTAPAVAEKRTRPSVVKKASVQISAPKTPPRNETPRSIVVSRSPSSDSSDVTDELMHLDQSSANSKQSKGSSTSTYLEVVSRVLYSKAKSANHYEKIGIAQALVELGDILLDDGKFRKAWKVLKRTEAVQKLIIDETIHSVASAFASHAERHSRSSTSSLYKSMAKRLQSQPTPASLKQAMELHREHKGGKTLERRLKRASAEAHPLAMTLKKQARCTAQYKKLQALLELQ